METKDYCKYCFREITWHPDADIDDETERICVDCDIKRDEARRDEALGI